MAGNKVGAETRKERDGNDIHSRIGVRGGKLSTRGYFGKLKDEGRLDELKRLSDQAVRSRNPEKRSEAAKKGWETRRQTGDVRRVGVNR